MPHLTSGDDNQAALDNELITSVLDPQSTLDLNRELEPGEKADDAVNYEDISDDDLAEDEEENRKSTNEVRTEKQDTTFTDLQDFAVDVGLGQIPSEIVPASANLDELFGDGPSSPVEQSTRDKDHGLSMAFDFEDDEGFGEPVESGRGEPALSSDQQLGSFELEQLMDDTRNVPSSTEMVSEEQLLQQKLFAQSRGLFLNSDFPPAPPENQEELLASLWPKFQKEEVPRFMDLLPLKRSRYVGKTPTKPPKPVQTTKVGLEIGFDQEKDFRFTTGSHQRSFNSNVSQGLIVVDNPQADGFDSEDDMDIESDFETEPIGGISWQDFQVICGDWDFESMDAPEPTVSEIHSDADVDSLFGQGGLLNDVQAPISKRQKPDPACGKTLDRHYLILPSLEDPGETTSNISRKVRLDLNDPYLLVAENNVDALRSCTAISQGQSEGHPSRFSLSKDLLHRYNISNDEAYNKLKQNHQNKVRSTLGNLSVNHSMPALRLQWPYYKTKLAKQEARSFHRPMAQFTKGEPITFKIPKTIKRKHLKGKDTQTIFNKTSDISLSDNSHSLLLEYSEEYPTMLSNFGMGSRVINYYRKKNQDDSERPKLDIGELAVLLPNDTSPLTQFGEIKPGIALPTIYNGLYKAPIYQHEPKQTDFLLIRNGNGVSGGSWYIRSMENLRVVGQQFPSIEVPPPGGRKVTTASKNRLRMISYRIIRRRKPHRISVQEVTSHFPDSTDMQNRQKMKDFMTFSKEHKEWEMRPGEPIPDEESIRAMVSPEDVCLLESMQVGQQHLEDSGYGDSLAENMNEDADDAKEGQSIDEQLAPWQTTKNFLNAATNKAMLQLHGEGDPSGRGLAFSFLKTSMKGGFKAIGESVEDKLDAKKLKELGGHSYNVQKQAESYRESIRRIWENQNQCLSSILENSDDDMDTDEQDEFQRPLGRGVTPRSETQPASFLRRRDDETMSQMSRFSADSQRGMALRITRYMKDERGIVKPMTELETDPRVIKQYIAKRRKLEADRIDITNIKADDNKTLAERKLADELARLERNKERRIARENQKRRAAGSPGSPNSTGANVGAKVSTGTQRKCANCGQVGHIKTNKKLCPLLNGTMKAEESFTEAAFSTSAGG